MTWPKVKLGDVCEINPRLNKSLAEDEAVSFVPMAAVSEVTGQVTTEQVLALKNVKNGLTPFKNKDILFAKITPCFENGKIARAQIGCAYGFGSTEFHVVRPKENADGQYLLHLLRTPAVRQEGAKRMTGSGGQKRVPKQYLADLEIPLPPLAEQKRLAAILDRADDLRRLHRQVLARLDELAQSLFLELFGDPATNPKGWETSRIGDICSVKGGKRLPKGAEYSATATPFRYIRVTDLREGKIAAHQLLYITPEVQKQVERYTVSAGDVVISIAGSIGITAPVTADIGGANLTENAAKLVPKGSDKYHAEYMSRALQTEPVQSQIAFSTGQVTIGKLALFRIEELQIPLPPLALQQTFAAQIEELEAVKARARAAATEADALFASLQSRAFAGELAADAAAST